MKRVLIVIIVLLMNQLVVAQNGLSEKHKSVVAISGTAAKADMVQLKKEIQNGLDNQLTINEIKEMFYQLYAYAGFPRSLNALIAFEEVLQERKSRGINDIEGKTATQIHFENKLESGAEIQAQLLGQRRKTSIANFAPTIDDFLKEHLFADIFSREVLDFKTRELVTISILASIQNAENQLQSHYKVSMYNGVSQEELHDFLKIIRKTIGKKEAKSAQKVLNKVLNNNK